MSPWIYNLFAYLIVGLAIMVALKKAYDTFTPKRKSSSCANGCGGCTTKCELKNLVNQSKINQ